MVIRLTTMDTTDGGVPLPRDAEGVLPAVDPPIKLGDINAVMVQVVITPLLSCISCDQNRLSIRLEPVKCPYEKGINRTGSNHTGTSVSTV